MKFDARWAFPVHPVLKAKSLKKYVNIFYKKGSTNKIAVSDKIYNYT